MAKQIEAVEFNLSPAEEAAAQRIYESLKGKADQQLLNMVRMLAAKEPRELLGHCAVRTPRHAERVGGKRLAGQHPGEP